MNAKDQFANPEHAKIYRCHRRETPKWIIEKAITCLKEKVSKDCVYEISLDLANFKNKFLFLQCYTMLIQWKSLFLKCNKKYFSALCFFFLTM